MPVQVKTGTGGGGGGGGARSAASVGASVASILVARSSRFANGRAAKLRFFIVLPLLEPHRAGVRRGDWCCPRSLMPARPLWGTTSGAKRPRHAKCEDRNRIAARGKNTTIARPGTPQPGEPLPLT